MADGKLRVIIAGAGIAGLSTAISLRRFPYIDVQLYDQAKELKEIGASIALSPNGLRTLEKLGVNNALDDEVAFRGPSEIPMIYRHWKTNEVVSQDLFANVPLRRHQTARFHRAHLHQALLSHVPQDRIHLKKRIINAEVHPDGIVAYFSDNTNAKGDILIGADGIHSNVRATFAPDHQLKWTGRTYMRSTFDASLVEGIPNLPLDSTHWWGLENTFFASRLGKNQFTVVGNYSPKDPTLERNIPSWNDEGDVKILRETFKDWNPVVKALVDATPYTRLYPNYAGDPLPSWTFGSRVTLVGDAAHAHGGAFATGGSLAIDDAYALFLAFHQAFPSSKQVRPSGTDISRALDLYEKTRRPHTEKLLKIVLSGVGKGTVTTDKELTEKMKSRPATTWLSEHDVEKAFADVVQAEQSVGESVGGSRTSKV